MVGGQCMCITTCLSIHVHLNPWHSGWWSVYVYHYCLSIHVHLKPWHSGWWSVYVYHCFFINSRTFKPLTQWLMVSVCVSLLVYRFTYTYNLDTVVGGQCMCITTCLSIHVHLNPWHSGWWSVYVYHYLFINSRTFKPLTQWLLVSVCVSLLVYQFTYT